MSQASASSALSHPIPDGAAIPRGAVFRALVSLTVLYAAHIVLVASYGHLRPERMKMAGTDPVAYYAYFHSLYFDGDLDFSNQYDLFGKGIIQYKKTPTGKATTAFSAGPAIALAPFWLAADAVAHVGGWKADGTTAPYDVAGFAGLIFYGWVALMLLGLWAGRHFGPWRGAGAAAVAWGATPLLFYCCPLALMPHAIGAAASALAILVVDAFPSSSRRSALRIGAALGLAMLMRWQNALFALYPVALSLERILRDADRRSALKREARYWALAAVVAMAVFSPQMAAWQVIYGRPLLMPREGFLLLGRPAALSVLFSARNGLFTWTPAAAIGVVGLLAAGKERRTRAAALFAIFLAQLLVNSSVRDWHGDWGFGMRRFTELAPVFAFGWGALLAWRRVRAARLDVAAAGAFLILWNEALVYQYTFHLISWDRPLTAHELFTDKLHLRDSYRRRLLVEKARALARDGDTAEALQTVRLAIELDPSHADAYEMAGLICEQVGDLNGALKDFDRALRISPDHPRVLEFRQRVQRALSGVGP